MNKVSDSIGWADFSINPVKGLCPMACSYCYARSMYKRFKWNPKISFDVKPLLDIEKIKRPSRIFVGSTIELFGEWVDAFWLDSIFRTVRDNPHHTFIFLTKQPQNLIKFSPYPPNVYLGVSVTNQEMFNKAIHYLKMIDAKVKFISFEPLLERITLDQGDYLILNKLQEAGIDWLILGGKSGKPPFYPHEEWIQEIEEAADKAGIPVFEKFNLYRDSRQRCLRQKFPERRV